MVATQKVLIIEDDLLLCEQMLQSLDSLNCDLFCCHTAEEGLQQAVSSKFDLVLLDVMIPVMGGWEACKKLRNQIATPIIFITAFNNTENIVRGLSLGADDYITKPLNLIEFQARIGAHLRRYQREIERSMVFGNGAIEIDVKKQIVKVRGDVVSFTQRELQLLMVLAQNAGHIVRTTDLITQAWGAEFADTAQNIKPYIHYLRKKIEADPAAPEWINTVRGVGYRFGK